MAMETQSVGIRIVPDPVEGSTPSLNVIPYTEYNRPRSNSMDVDMGYQTFVEAAAWLTP